MVEYLPWSETVLKRCISLHKQNKLATLDLELSAKCSGAYCIYCDSKPSVGCVMPNELDWETLKVILEQAAEVGLEWIYTCGLGEPLEDDKFFEMLDFLKKNNIRLSMFSNGVFIDSANTATALKKAGVNIILKMDTFEKIDFDKILGVSGTAEKIYKALELLLSVGYGNKSGETDLAFSIVPTKLSITGIPAVIDFAQKNGIFASLGELEQAGEVITNNLSPVLSLAEDEINTLNTYANNYAGKKYMRPICPSIITGIHIDNLGCCIVDKKTGLNCKWFMLQEPDVEIIGDAKTENIYDLFLKVKAYRKKYFSENADIIEQQSTLSYIFGGCGGNPCDIIHTAKEALA
jgi:MoaA/NifB/PqqE/SkfB family radical SAM enzyme